MDENATVSQVPFYEQVFASLAIEREVIEQFLAKLQGATEEGKIIHYAAALKVLQDTMKKDGKEVMKSAQSIIEKFEELDEVNASNRWRTSSQEDSLIDQNFRNMRSTYIMQVEAVLQVVDSLAGLARQSVDGADSSTDWSDTLSETDSMIDIRRRLEGLRRLEVDPAEGLIIELKGVPERFNYNDLSTATGNFSEKLGEGGFGSVYRGVLPSGTEVAVKRMNAVSTNGQGMKEFEREVFIITQLRHRNLIELQGWCEDQARKEYMLVYQLMHNGSLDKKLFNPVECGGAQEKTEGTTGLSWPQRFTILKGTSDGLRYLHEGCMDQVIHGDIKCANILLDKDLNAKLTDFGLSRLMGHQEEAYTIRCVGTQGYVSPELSTEGKVSDKSDVYAFGVVVLEVVCGRRNWPGGAYKMSLVQWVRECLNKGEVISTVDKELRESDMQQIQTVLMIGLACCELDYRKRPSMDLVVKMFDGERYKTLRKMVMDEEKEVSVIQLEGVPERFSYNDLSTATGNFSEKLWKAWSGSVYRGVLPSGIEVAVKRMNAVSTHGQGMEVFEREVFIKTQLRHQNLIELLGWCKDQARKEYMLVYELMPYGSLHKLLFNPVKPGGAEGRIEGTTCLSWPLRFRILKGTAHGLRYLHEGFIFQVIHGHITCSNVLLDKDLNAKLTDFGLSRLIDHQAYNYLAGTLGYISPELWTEGKVTEKSDVFAFGVVVLEVVCGRRNLPGGAHKMSLVQWVRECLNKGDVISAVDKELRESDMQQIQTVLMIGLACCELDYRKRPSMDLIVKMFGGERYGTLKKIVMVEEKENQVAEASAPTTPGDSVDEASVPTEAGDFMRTSM